MVWGGPVPLLKAMSRSVFDKTPEFGDVLAR
jgi:hypothetical protein